MSKYELLLTLPGTLDDNEVKQELGQVTEVLNEFVEKPDIKNLGKIRLAYPIRQIRYGYFYTIIFEVEPRVIPEMNKKLVLNKIPLRIIISKYNPGSGDIQLVMSSQPTFKGNIKEKMTLDDVMTDQKEEKVGEVANRNENIEKGVNKEEKSIDLEDIDKKLDEILDSTEIV